MPHIRSQKGYEGLGLDNEKVDFGGSDPTNEATMHYKKITYLGKLVPLAGIEVSYRRLSLQFNFALERVIHSVLVEKLASMVIIQSHDVAEYEVDSEVD